jgi:hypothetical protein
MRFLRRDAKAPGPLPNNVVEPSYQDTAMNVVSMVNVVNTSSTECGPAGPQATKLGIDRSRDGTNLKYAQLRALAPPAFPLGAAAISL